ncbi:MAG TPA: ATP-binding cassette domain-containing protein [Puia sp.]
MTHTLEADSISLEFGLRPILSDIHIKCRTGEITGLLGRNGQGKTCLMRILYGDLEASGRSVRFDNIAVLQAYKQPEWLSYLPQFNFIPESLTLQRVFNDFDLEFSELEQRFPQFRVRQKSRIRDLSGGEKRLINVYLIVRSRSRFALLDEPFSHLMPIQIDKIKEMMLEEKDNKGFLITDHLYRHITGISDKFYILADGRTHLARDTEDIERLGYARL